ncbi:MAG: metalloprotease TldD [Rhodospirillales bacterium]|nr:metalloprotease TldD [Rhodospirillales bacterium]
MTDLSQTDDLFFAAGALSREKAEAITGEALHDADDGELFLEYRQSESIMFDDGRVKSASFDTAQGFGLRAVSGEATGYAHASELSEDALLRASDTVQAVTRGHSGAAAVPLKQTNRALYGDDNPLALVPFEDKVNLLAEMDAYARSLDPEVKQVTASVLGSWQAVQIIRADGMRVADIRPLVRLNVQVVLEKDGRMEMGSHGMGGRVNFDTYLKPETWKPAVDEALRQARVNMQAEPAPAGEMIVVLGAGWPGILLHEAIGHGLEGDFNRKKTSAFAGLRGERVASLGVTVVDDGTIQDRRGSLTIDDEGTPSSCTTLIEDGILKGYMQDRMNAHLMGEQSTGNGRRQSYAHMPMPRMTNTYMLPGDKNPDEIIASVDKGLYATSFGGGQVDITNGKFVFTCIEAYKIENGKATTPVKGATLIGSGPDVLTKVSMVGDDLEMDPGIGTCGKNGQGVPVGVGQPTLRIDGLTVGGTAVE